MSHPNLAPPLAHKSFSFSLPCVSFYIPVVVLEYYFHALGSKYDQGILSRVLSLTANFADGSDEFCALWSWKTPPKHDEYFELERGLLQHRLWHDKGASRFRLSTIFSHSVLRKYWLYVDNLFLYTNTEEINPIRCT